MRSDIISAWALNSRWTLNVYIYVANVPPTAPDWKAKGGRVFTLIKHSGNFPRREQSVREQFGLTGWTGGVNVHDHEPREYDRKEDDNYFCTCLFPLCTNFLNHELA